MFSKKRGNNEMLANITNIPDTYKFTNSINLNHYLEQILTWKFLIFSLEMRNIKIVYKVIISKET